MILFCDTSALVKLYIVEPSSEDVKALAAAAEAVAVCRIAWAEYHAATARHGRDHPQHQPLIDHARRSLAAQWRHYLVVEVTQAVVERAADYADAFALRGHDAVQLAAAAEARSESHDNVVFACFDRRLNVAARLLDMKTPFAA